MPTAVEYSDVQGLVRFGFGKMTEACYLLLTIRNPIAARAWIGQTQFTTAVEMSPPPVTALQIAFTRQGLERLGVPTEVMAGFSSEFLEGMAGGQNRSRRLGDSGANAPESWEWGAATNVPDLVLMLFAGPGKLDAWEQSVKRGLWAEGFAEMRRLSTSNLDGREPFGFIDGISQPVVDWSQSRHPSRNADQLAYGNVVCLGEFLLGYLNEYGLYTDRPLVDPKTGLGGELPDADDRPGIKDLGKNGTYLVIRQLDQDVRGFWRYMEQASKPFHTSGYEIAEAMVGRRLQDGAPLAGLSSTRIPGVGDTGNDAQRARDTKLNQFVYAADPEGVQCPVGAHVRRGNPRTPDLPGNPDGLISHAVHLLGFGDSDPREDLVASVRFHRLLRRGREYGPNLTPEDALQEEPQNDPERGLHFVAINANIERQFEFVQNAWIARTKFDGLTEESDPLLGNREPVDGCPFADAFSIPHRDKVRSRVLGLPRFVTVRGGAYFFLPGIRALRFLSTLGG
jgi:deferrochelatase/peroxidase EfeB